MKTYETYRYAQLLVSQKQIVICALWFANAPNYRFTSVDGSFFLAKIEKGRQSTCYLVVSVLFCFVSL